MKLYIMFLSFVILRRGGNFMGIGFATLLFDGGVKPESLLVATGVTKYNNLKKLTSLCWPRSWTLDSEGENCSGCIQMPQNCTHKPNTQKFECGPKPSNIFLWNWRYLSSCTKWTYSYPSICQPHVMLLRFHGSL